MPHGLVDCAFFSFVATVYRVLVGVIADTLTFGVILLIVAVAIGGLLGFCATFWWKRLPAPGLESRNDVPRSTTRKVKRAD